MRARAPELVRASEPSANCKWPKSKWDKCGLVYLFVCPGDQSTPHKARERIGTKFYHFRWLDDVVYNNINYTGHMVAEAEEALKDQTVRISVQNIFLFTAFSRFKGIFGNLKSQRNRII